MKSFKNILYPSVCVIWHSVLSDLPQSTDASSRQKSEVISRMEDKMNQMAGTIKQLETRWLRRHIHIIVIVVSFLSRRLTAPFPPFSPSLSLSLLLFYLLFIYHIKINQSVTNVWRSRPEPWTQQQGSCSSCRSSSPLSYTRRLTYNSA